MALIACLGVLALTAGGAVADDSGAIVVATVHPASGQPFQDSVSPAQLFANPGRCPLYTGGPITEYGRTGPETPPENPQRTWLLGTALSCMPTPINPATLPNLNVIVTGSDGAPESGTNSQLTAADLSNPSDFPNSALGQIVESARDEPVRPDLRAARRTWTSSTSSSRTARSPLMSTREASSP